MIFRVLASKYRSGLVLRAFVLSHNGESVDFEPNSRNDNARTSMSSLEFWNVADFH